MSPPGDRPVVPMKGQPATARPPTTPQVPPTAASVAQPTHGTVGTATPRLRLLRSRRSLQNPSMIAFVVVASLAVLLGVASILGGSSLVPDIGENGGTTEATDAAGSPATSVSSSEDSTSRPVTTTTIRSKPEGFVDLEALAITSVVSIDIYSDGELCSGGTGSAVLDGSYVLTNLHVVEDDDEYDCFVDEIVVRYLERVDEDPIPGFTAKVVVTDRASDLAVLLLTRKPNISKQLTPVVIGSGATVNEDLYIAGFPSIGGDSITFSRGIVSGFLQEDGVRWIKTDAQISGGNSGGPAFNSRGELVGVPTRASASSSGDVVDCRIVEDTNGDGRINDRDACVPIGGSFSLLSPASAAENILRRVKP